MAETWRKKHYYRPRVVVPTEEILNPSISGGLMFLSGSEIGLITTLLAYAKRRSTFASEYHESFYLAPTNEEWDDLELIVGALEDTLMTDCCADLVAVLETINTTLQEHDVSLVALATQTTLIAGDVPGIVAGLECICGRIGNLELNVTVSPDWPNYPDTENYFDWGTGEPDPTIPAQGDSDACDLAQAWYQAGFELMTEVVLPTMRFGFDKVLPAAAALLAAITGGTSIPVTMGVYAFAELIQELLELAYDAAETNLENWLFVHKEDLVCPMYVVLKDGGTMSSVWPNIYADVIAPAGDLSLGDKLLISFAYRGVAMAAANVAKTQNSAWYQSVPEAGYCDSCEEDPIIGSNWWALPISAEDGYLHIDHPPGPAWVPACFNWVLPGGGQSCLGMVYEVLNETGDCGLSRNSATTCGCPNLTLWPDSSGDSTPGEWYAYTAFSHNVAEAIATLCPGAGEWQGFMQTQGPDVSAGFRTGFDCEGSVDIQVKYLVFSGTTPP